MECSTTARVIRGATGLAIAIGACLLHPGVAADGQHPGVAAGVSADGVVGLRQRTRAAEPTAARRGQPWSTEPIREAPVAVAAAAKPNPTVRARVTDLYGRLPLAFEANSGQADPDVRFLTRGAGYTLLLTPTEAVFVLSGGMLARHDGDPPELKPGKRTEPAAHTNSVLRVTLTGANPQPEIAGLDVLPGVSHYAETLEAEMSTPVQPGIRSAT